MLELRKHGIMGGRNERRACVKVKLLSVLTQCLIKSALITLLICTSVDFKKHVSPWVSRFLSYGKMLREITN